MLKGSVVLALGAFLTAAPASAQFYKDKTLTLLVNYGVGGNADTEARASHYGDEKIRGTPTVLFNGKVAPVGGGGREDAEDLLKDYRKVIDPLLESTEESCVLFSFGVSISTLYGCCKCRSKKQPLNASSPPWAIPSEEKHSKEKS